MQDYGAKFLPKLAGQFENSPKLKAMVSAILSFFDDLETEADLLKTERWIDTAVGAQLDGCGYIVGESRNGMSDDDYRDAIRYRIFVNVSGATPTTFIQAIKFLTDPTDSQYLEAYPATAMLFTDGYFVSSLIQSQIQEVAPAGISDVPVLVSFGKKPFRCGKAAGLGNLFANASYLKVNGKILRVTNNNQVSTGSTLGGVVPSQLSVNGMLLQVNGMGLAVYNPNTTISIGDYKLAGVYE